MGDSNIGSPSALKQIADLAQKPGAVDVAKDGEELLELVVGSAHKDGIKTTEFWLTLLVVLFGMGITGWQVYAGKLDLPGAVVWLTTIAGAAKYLHDRAAVKIAASAVKAFVFAFALTGVFASSGCSPAAIRQIETDIHTGAVLLAGAATVAEENPAYLETVRSLGVTLAGKAGLSPADQAILTSAITEGNAEKIKAVAVKVANGTAAIASSGQ